MFGLALLALLLTVTVACSSENKQVAITPAPNSLSCDDCELTDVLNVIDANTLSTSIGDVQLYGAYVIDQPADCAAQAEERLRGLAGSQIRIENGPSNSTRQDDSHYYVFTHDGQSIEEKLISEGLALTWTQDGQHLGWFLFLDAAAKQNESGCLWHDYQAFQRGEPNEFRIPGLTYPDSNPN